MRKKFAEFSIVCSVTKVIVCYLLNKRMATFAIVPYCQQIVEHSAAVILQSIRGRILHSAKCFHRSNAALLPQRSRNVIPPGSCDVIQ